MKWTGLNELREKYLSFFESKGHLRLPSYSLVPVNDKSLLLINSGMAPLKKFFTGEEEPPRHRVTTAQKCIRTPDLERVGITARHGTYFEMLGNFSFGDYFKREAIHWSWEFLTECIEIPGELLWPSVYEKDEEAYNIWKNEIGIPEERIVRLGKEDNFWEHGSGPCGPCSEIYFDRGEKYGCGSPDCKPGCDCDRYMEIWNNVFTQFDNDGKGNYTELTHKNIDTGMGLERLACVMQGVDSLFEVDTVRRILDTVCEISGVKYGADVKSDISIRVVTDHIRSATFMICDGVIPSNEGRGYVLRRLLRRAARHGKLLGINHAFLSELCEVVIEQNENAYPALVDRADYIKKVISIEEERFDATVDAGLEILGGFVSEAEKTGSKVISGADAFKLSDTYGFPLDLTREIVSERGLKVDEDEFNALMLEQKNRARAARANISGWSEASKDLIFGLAQTEFEGYDKTECEGKIIALINESGAADEITEGEFSLVADKTVFYGEGGGQVGDTGVITVKGSAEIEVFDTQKDKGVYVHLCRMLTGKVKTGDTVEMKVDAERREAIRRNHSSAHLLQAALRTVLGSHVEQAGSYVNQAIMRFDFSHFAPMTAEELTKVEDMVNAEILRGDEIKTVVTDIESAKKLGAMALFGEKYGKTVRVVCMGDFSRELCGGIHADNTAKLGMFKIISESSVAAGVRRIEAVTGLNVLELIRSHEALISCTAKELKVQNQSEIEHRAHQLQDELREQKREVEKLSSKLASASVGDIAKNAVKVGNVRVAVMKTDGMTADAARGCCDNIKAENSDIVVILATAADGKYNFVAACGKDAVAAGAHAGNVLKQVSAIAGGNGGGRPDSAVSGCKNPEKIDEALAAAADIVGKMLK